MRVKFIHWKIRDRLFDKKMAKQRYIRGFSDEMSWGMFSWFTNEFPKIVYNLRNIKHGSPELDFEEVENFSKTFIEQCKKEYEINNIYYREDFVSFSIYLSYYVVYQNERSKEQ